MGRGAGVGGVVVSVVVVVGAVVVVEVGCSLEVAVVVRPPPAQLRQALLQGQG